MNLFETKLHKVLLELKWNNDDISLGKKPKSRRHKPYSSLGWEPKTPNYDTFGKNDADIWRDAWEHGLNYYKDKGQWKDQTWHPKMVKYLHLLGLEDEANDLELVRPSEEDIALGNRPVVNQPLTPKEKESFVIAHRVYFSNVEHILNVLGEIGKQHGWVE
jgi:hypothetical protein